MGTARAVRSDGPAALPLLPRRGFLAVAAALTAALAACGDDSPAPAADQARRLTIGAIPDQDPEVLQRQHRTVADALASALHLDVTYQPVTDYAAAGAQRTDRFAAFFHAMLDQGVYLPPSAFEVWFLSAAHDSTALDRIVTALPAAARAAQLP